MGLKNVTMDDFIWSDPDPMYPQFSDTDPVQSGNNPTTPVPLLLIGEVMAESHKDLFGALMDVLVPQTLIVVVSLSLSLFTLWLNSFRSCLG